MHCHRFRLLLIAPLLLGLALAAFAQEGDHKKKEEGFRFRFVGPAIGNRVASIAGVPGDPSTYYAGAASGGVWKSTDGGNRWEPIFDKEPVAAIGALAVAPSDPSIVWAGTGEAWAIRDTDVTGNGVYKSTDAGKTWTHIGLDQTGRVARVIVNPQNANIVFVCALGRLTGPQQERGVYRTLDGGQHWDRVLFADENTGCSGLSLDPQNPLTLFAGMWQAEMHTYAELSGGPGSGIWVSHDGGSNWTRIQGHGLPKSPVGKIDLAVAPTDSNRVYALIQTADQGSVWRSDDGGENWQAVNWDRSLIGRAGYYIRLAVSPRDENEVLVANSSFHHSLDGGHTFRPVPWGGDTHDIWFDPKNADRFVITDDGGLIITTVHGRGFHHVTLPIGQMYHVAVDNQVPYYVYGNMQDDGTMRGPSTSPPLGYGDSPDAGWDHHMGGCESGFTLPDLTDPNIIWATCYGDEVTRWDARAKMARSVSPWLHTLDSPPTTIKYRCHWTPPLAIDPFDYNTVYYGCQVIFKTSNGGQSWSVISPDLSTQDPSHIVSSGGIVGDNLGQFYGEVVYAISPSTIQKDLIWAGTNDGQVWYTRDGGGHWNNVTRNIAGMPAWGTITSIQPSFFDPGTAYISVDLHLMDNRDPYIYKTADFGRSWKLISSNLPKHPLAYVRVVAEDPNQKGLLFAGTGNSLYYTLDDGGHWTNLQEGLPHSTVSWAVVQRNFHDLVVSTYGRGIYILDDISPLEQMAHRQSESGVRLFASRPAYRFARMGRAFLTYSLPQAAKDPVKIAILGPDGQVIRDLKATGKAGMNRVDWDLHYEGPRVVALRTTPEVNAHIWQEPRFWGKDSRPITHWGISEHLLGPMAAPGKYTVRLTVDGHKFTTPLEILRDARASATDAEIQASVKLQLRIRDEISEVADMVNRLEWMRKQLHDVTGMLRAEKGNPELIQSAEKTGKQMEDVEYRLVSRSLTASDDKYYVESYKVYYNLLWLNAEIGPGAGDVAGGTDFPPTDTEYSLLSDIEKDLASAKVEYAALLDKSVPAFNRALLEHGVMPLPGAAPAVEVSAPAGVGKSKQEVTRQR
jgi:photosystem II stability/assembly factor-like uncharacterized protein